MKYALYRGIHRGQFAVPHSVHDDPGRAADVARRLVFENIARAETVGDPLELAVLVLPVRGSET